MRQRLLANKRAFSSQPRRLVLKTETAVIENNPWEMMGRLPDPDDVMRKAGLTRDKLRVLESDDEIYAALETRRDGVIATPWRIEGKPEMGEKGRDVAQAIWLHIEPHMSALMRDLWGAVPYGYSVVELVYREVPGFGFGLDRAVGKPFEWFSPNTDGRLHYTAPGTGMPMEVDTQWKFILTRRNATYRQPYGDPILSRLYWPWFLRQEGWKMWARYLERHGSPILLGRVPELEVDDATMQNDIKMAQLRSQFQAEIDAVRDSLAEAVRSAVIATTADVQAISPANAGEAFSSFNAEINKRIQKVILGQTLTSDVGSSGSYAAAKVHDMVRQDRLHADMALVRDGVQRIIDNIADLNGWPRPVFAWTIDAGIQLDRAERDAKLVQAGVLRLTEQYAARAYDFEPGDFEIPRPTQAPTPAPTQAPTEEPEEEDDDEDETDETDNETFSMKTQPTRFTPEQQAIEDGIASLPKIDPIPAGLVRSAILAARDPEDLERRLAVLIGQDNPQFTTTLTQAMFTASVMGFVDSAKDSKEPQPKVGSAEADEVRSMLYADMLKKLEGY